MKSIRRSFFYVLLILIGFSRELAAQQKNLKLASQPNIILFLVDDMGWQDTSVPFWDSTTDFNRRYHTPNMERLTREGLKFTNAYAAPVCSPTRVSLMTGMNPAHTRVTNYTTPGSMNESTDYKDSMFQEVPWNINGLSTIPGVPRTIYATTFPTLLRDAGYFTIHIGKGHFGPHGTPGANPRNLGFDVEIAGHSAGSPQSYKGQDNYGNNPGHTRLNAVPDLEEYYGKDTFLTEALTLEAKKALDNPVKHHQPFFLYMAHYAVHVPLMDDDRFYQKYLDEGIEEQEAKYASMIEGMDKSLGDLMDYLKQHNLEKNTIIIFMSDNGGLALAPPRGGKPFTQNLPLRSGKGSVYEGGIREPMIVRWPGITKPGSVADQYVIIEDFFPTILQLAGIKNYKTIQKLDGRSLVPVLKNPSFTDSNRILVWHFPNKWIPKPGPGINYRSAIRQGDWKLVYSMKQKKLELYNLKNDIGEQNDLSKVYPNEVSELSGLLTKKLKAWNAQMPVYKASGKPVSWPDEIPH